MTGVAGWRGELVAEKDCGAAKRRLEACSDDGVDDQIVGLGKDGLHGIEVGEDAEMDDGLLGHQIRVGFCRRPFEISGVGEQAERDLATRVDGEDARGDQAIAAVVALAAEDEDVDCLPVMALDETGDGGSGVLHERVDGDTVGDGAAVGFGHIGCSKDRDHDFSDVRLRDVAFRFSANRAFAANRSVSIAVLLAGHP